MKKDSKIIYIAAPYSHSNGEVEAERALIATRVATRLIQDSYVAFSPLTHAQPIREIGGDDIPKGWEFWMHLDQAILEVSALLIVLKLDGWDKSEGVNREVQIAYNNAIPILYVEQYEIPILEQIMFRYDHLIHDTPTDMRKCGLEET